MGLIEVFWVAVLAAACLPSRRYYRAVLELLQRLLQLGLAALVAGAAWLSANPDRGPWPVASTASGLVAALARAGVEHPEAIACLLLATAAVLAGLPLIALLESIRSLADESRQQQRMVRQLQALADELGEIAAAPCPQAGRPRALEPAPMGQASAADAGTVPWSAARD